MGTRPRLAILAATALCLTATSVPGFAQPRIVGSGPTGEASGVQAPARPAAQPDAAATQPSGPAVVQPGDALPPRPARQRPGAGVAPVPAEPVATAVPEPAMPVATAETPAARALLRIDQIEAELRGLTDRIDRLEAENRQIRAENTSLREALAAPARTADTGVADSPAAAAVVADAAPAATAPAAQSTPGATAPAHTTAATPATTPAASPATGTATPAPARVASLSDGASAMSVLREARLDLQTRDYQGAEAKLTALLATWADAPEAAEARWLLGETRYVQQAWGPAAEAYVGYLSAHADGRRVPEIYLRLAGVFRQVNDPDQRCRALGAFTETVPEPGPVLKARYDQEVAAGAACPA